MIFDFLFKSKKDRKARVINASSLRSVTDYEHSAYFATAQDTSADEVCSEGERSTLRANCRKILLDCPNAMNAARSLALSVYGAGPTLQVKTPDAELNRSIEKLFNRWRKASKYDLTFFTAIQALPSDGEAFFHITTDPSNCFSLGIELIEPYRVREPMGVSMEPDRFCGIKYDEFNRPMEYTVVKSYPNPNYNSTINEYVTIPAGQIEHLYIPILAAQRRGLPLLQSAIQTMAGLKKIEDATLSAVETAANISFVIESGLDPDNISNDCQLAEGQTFEAFDTVKLPGRNNGLYLPSGMKATQFKPEQPGINYNTFKNDCLLGVGAALSAPKNIILNDSSSYNYSSARLDAQIFERWADVLRAICTPILDKHFKMLMATLLDNPDVQKMLNLYESIDDIPVAWYFAQPTHIDRAKEASADALLFQNHAKTLRDFYAQIGKDWRDELEQIALEQKIIKEKGLDNGSEN